MLSMAQDLIGYDSLARDALRGVVKSALALAAGDGLPGAHHFYITFKTRAPGVNLDPALVEQYPSEMTIVLEHQFWELGVSETEFEVTLKFDGIPKYLSVPYDAVTQFFDPSVGFRLRFESADEAPASMTAPENASAPAEASADNAPGQVVSLDAFRKKSEH